MKQLRKLILILSITFLPAQTNIIPEGFNGFSVSMKHDQNVDFFGEGKFFRSSFNNNLNVGYIYNGTVSIDLNYGYSLFDRKDEYFIDENNAHTSGDDSFNFIDNFRVENREVGDKGFSFGLTYYINESQTIFPKQLPVNLSLGFRYGNSSYTSDNLDALNQDFYGKFYSLEFGVYKEIETAASFFMIPRINLHITNEKNIYDSFINEGETESFNLSSNYFEVALPFVLERATVGKPYFEPSISNRHGSTHLGFKFGFLF